MSEQPPSSGKVRGVMRARTLEVAPLSAVAYAPYGDVIMASPRGEVGAPANAGTATRFDRLAKIENLRPGRAELNVSVFRCAPRGPGELTLAMLEKHPMSTQAFIPMNASRYFVVVALGAIQPDLTTLRAFEAAGTQGVSYRPGVWHHPMIALDGETTFTCLVCEAGEEDDCVVFDIPDSDRFAVAI